MIENFQEDSMKMQTDFGFSNEATQFRALPRSHNTNLLSHVVHQEMEENYSKQSLSYDQKLSEAIRSADYIFKQQKQSEESTPSSAVLSYIRPTNDNSLSIDQMNLQMQMLN